VRALALGLLAACGAPPVVAPIANRAVAPDAYLVWRAPANGAPTTRWVDGDGHVLGTAPGIVIASGETLYRLTTREVTPKLRTCEQIDNEQDRSPPAGEDAKGVLVSLEPVGGGRAIALDKPVDTEHMSELDWGTTLAGSLGPLVFLEHRRTAYACGAHGDTDVTARVFDLEQHAVIAPIATDADAAAPEIHDRAWPALSGPADGFDDALHVAEVLPAWSKGALAPRWLLWTNTCYACTVGDWADYTASTWIDGGPVPSALAAVPPVPPAVAALLEAHGDHVGVSWGHAGSAAWHAAFR
jgi:hypothetical protein